MSPEWRGGGQAEWVGADISTAIDVAQDRLRGVPGTHFVQADLLQLPFREHSFDAIFSEGVLHHTPSTERAVKTLATLLVPGGELLFYVYRKKGPIREFTDDWVRQVLSTMSPQEAWEALRPLTKLGQALAEVKTEVTVPEDIPYLGIQAGRYDVQRLVYWHFAKLFWRPECSFEENHHVNFDWYHPRYAHRHTREEIHRWCGEAGLTVRYCDEQESGFTVRAVRG
jgi:SAM-dependent methyltransferase